MKTELTCGICQDLLPSYIEKLTCDETNQAIQDHLEHCADCLTICQEMMADIDRPEKAVKIELNFLKKVKRTRLLAAVLCVILTLYLSYSLYAMEYAYARNDADLSVAVTEFLEPFKPGFEAYVLETKEIDGVLFASFKDKSDSRVNGIAQFNKGLNQRYRIIESDMEVSDYSSIVQLFRVEVKDEPYIAVSGYQLSDDIRSYGIDYFTYSKPGSHSEDRSTESVLFDVKNQQFLEFHSAKEVESRLLDSADQPIHEYYLGGTSLFDAQGVNITENFRSTEGEAAHGSSGTSKAELFLLYVYIAIVIAVGAVMTRYFWVPGTDSDVSRNRAG